MRIRMLRGRSFTDQDNGAGPPVAIINQAMAKKFWPDGADPLRDRLTIGKGVMKEFSGESPRQIIGIVGDIRHGAMNENPQSAMFVPQAQLSDTLTLLHNEITPLAWVAKLRPGVSGEIVRDELRKATALPVSDVRMTDEVVSRSISRQRFHMLLMSVFGGAALMLAAIGVYALMSYTVQQRTQEIGIRMALGAQVEDVQRMVIRDGLRFSLAGVLAGLLGAALLARQISSFLYGVESRDPLVFAIIPVVLVLTALVALWIPARRATRVDPVTALRAE
jgi:putative ABC transport system permease protein